MDIDAITGTVQLVNLLLFAAALVMAWVLARRFEWSRMWLIPAVTWILNGLLFYTVVVMGWSDTQTRTLWSAGLRLHSVILMLMTLLVVYWMATKDGDA